MTTKRQITIDIEDLADLEIDFSNEKAELSRIYLTEIFNKFEQEGLDISDILGGVADYISNHQTLKFYDLFLKNFEDSGIRQGDYVPDMISMLGIHIEEVRQNQKYKFPEILGIPEIQYALLSGNIENIKTEPSLKEEKIFHTFFIILSNNTKHSIISLIHNALLENLEIIKNSCISYGFDSFFLRTEKEIFKIWGGDLE